MAEIKSYTLNFVFGRRAQRALTCAARKLACNEIQRGLRHAEASAHG